MGKKINYSNLKILKAKRLVGKTLIFRNVETSDVNFILSLRTDSEKSKYLNKTSSDVSRQVAWLENYTNKDEEAYFIIENKNGLSLGTIRIYDARGDSFCWGSWILKDGVPISTAIESALMMYSYSFEHLGFKRAHLDMRKGNESVRRFHEFCGAWQVGETDIDYLYEIDFEKFIELRTKTSMHLNELRIDR
jgi:RimJ/RimL family protein N-acetyltransferase